MNVNFGINPAALTQADKLLTSLGKGPKPEVQSTNPPDYTLEQMEQDRYKQQQDLTAKRDIEQLRLGAKAQEALMKNALALQQSQEGNALKLAQAQMSNQMQAKQPPYQGGNAATQQAVNNQYDTSMVPRYLGNIG